MFYVSLWLVLESRKLRIDRTYVGTVLKSV